MIEVAHIYRGHTLKRVWLRGATASPDEHVVAVALKATGETKESVFGTEVQRFDNTVQVTLHTD